MAFAAHKVLSALPSPLDPDAIYYVRDGSRVRQYVTSSGPSPVAYLVQDTALVDEISTARAGRANLNERLTGISNIAGPGAGGRVVGNFYDNAFQASAATTVAGVANRIEIAPFFVNQPCRFDQIGVSVSTAVAGAAGKVLIYDSGANNWPDTLAFGSEDLDLSTAGYKFSSVDITFDEGRLYWVGFHHSSTAGIRAVPVASLVNIGVNGSGGANYMSIIRRTAAFADAPPDPWVFAGSELTANASAPSIRMRAAAI
ncbi:MAG: hypothetical protein J0L51_06995 [Rhizobiales bacterium]|nr:hypothetical protein [Hyphomicrobiales bacterium]